jgi:hypothetical protein
MSLRSRLTPRQCGWWPLLRIPALLGIRASLHIIEWAKSGSIVASSMASPAEALLAVALQPSLALQNAPDTLIDRVRSVVVGARTQRSHSTFPWAPSK